MIGIQELIEDTMNLLCLKYRSEISVGWDSTFVHFHVRKFGTVVKIQKLELKEYTSPQELIRDMRVYIEPISHPPMADFNDLRPKEDG